MSKKNKNRRIYYQKKWTDWKRCKYMGSLLDTEEHIKRRKALAIATYNKLKYISENKSTSMKNKEF